MSSPTRDREGTGTPSLSDLRRRQYHVLLEAIPDAAFVQDGDGRLIAVNAAAARITGFERVDLLSRRMRDLLSPEAYHQVMHLLASADSHAGSPSIAARLITREGASVPVEIHVSFLREPDEPLVVHYVARETGLEGRLENAREREMRFRLMANNLTEMVLAYDMDRRLTFANNATETLTGYSLAELERQQFICWIHPEDRPRMLRIWDRVFEGKSFHEEEYRMITRDGRMKWIAASWGPILDDSGKQVGVQGRERDITERRMAEESRRQAEQRLRFNEQRYRAIFEGSPFPLWEEDFSLVKSCLDELAAAGVTNFRAYFSENREALVEAVRRVRILDINRAALEFYGAPAKEQLLGDLNQLFDDAAYEIFAEELAVLRENQSRFKVEFQTRTLAGEERTVSMIVSLANPPADWSRVIVTFFDVTDRKHLEEQVLQSQKLESLGRLAGGVAHDFNNLLTVINGYCDLLIHDAPEEHSFRHGLGEIRAAGVRGAELTQQLLAFSRKQVAQLRPLSLNALIQESEGMLQRVIGEDVRLVVSLDPAAGTVKADRGQLSQVLMNLVVNGRDAMPGAGVLTIETRNVRLDAGMRENPECHGARPYVLLRVSDTGVGMDARTRERVFEPFFTTKRHGKGAGLGLASVFGVVTQSGGHISVASEPGAGSVFSVYLPLMAGPAAAEVPAERRAEPSAGAATILVVEDQTHVRELTCKLLRRMGYEVLEAADGPDALAAARGYGRPIGLLLTDVIMPGMNGREVAAQLTLLQPRIQVIFMSGYTDRVMGDGLIDSTVRFLQKPFTPEQLLHMVRRALES